MERNAVRECSHAVQGESLLARAKLYNYDRDAHVAEKLGASTAWFHRASPDDQAIVIIC